MVIKNEKEFFDTVVRHGIFKNFDQEKMGDKIFSLAVVAIGNALDVSNAVHERVKAYSHLVNDARTIADMYPKNSTESDDLCQT